MSSKQTRLALILVGFALLGLAAGLMLYAFSSNIQFFCTPTDLRGKGNCHEAGIVGRRMRLGGIVLAGSVVDTGGFTRDFIISDTLNQTKVLYRGKEPLPDLFKEAKGAVAEGEMQKDGSFWADVVLAKHDENYMPRDLMDKMKARGVKLGASANP